MIDTFRISFRLKNTYKANSIIHSLKSLPLIKRILPETLYASAGLKALADVISILFEICSAFFGKALYMFLAVYLPSQSMEAKPQSFLHIFIFTTIAGGIMNTQIFNPTRDKYYAMILMRMDPREYTVSNYIYFIVKTVFGFLPFTLLFGLMCGVNVYICLIMPVYVGAVKLISTALSLRECKKSSKSKNENIPSVLMWISTLLLLAAAYVLPALEYAFITPVLPLLCGAIIIPAVFALKFVFTFDSYRSIYRDLLKPENYIESSAKTAAAVQRQKALQKKLDTDISVTSNKTGYKYFNDIFVKRHSKLLTKSAKRITLIALCVLLLAEAAIIISGTARTEINGLMLTYLPYFLFVMYFINRGKVITQAMFMNCDHSMLAYRFYRQPGALLLLFNERLKSIIIISLMPASVIAFGLPVLLYISGGTDNPLNYLLLFVSIIAMSIFFSIHNMVLYYLFQPYNINMETKNALYGILNYATYYVCYFAIGKKAPTLYFGAAVSAFCIIYASVALLLVYKLAPKRFKLHN